MERHHNKIYALRIVAPPKAYRVSGMERQRKCGKPDRSVFERKRPISHSSFTNHLRVSASIRVKIYASISALVSRLFSMNFLRSGVFFPM